MSLFPSASKPGSDAQINRAKLAVTQGANLELRPSPS